MEEIKLAKRHQVNLSPWASDRSNSNSNSPHHPHQVYPEKKRVSRVCHIFFFLHGTEKPRRSRQRSPGPP